MKVTTKILLIALIICLPVISILLAENAICRMPDLYVHEFTQAEVSDKIGADMSNAELGQFFSDFMIGKTEKFTYTTYEAEYQHALFTKKESRYMSDARGMLNVLTAVLAGAAVIAAAACIFFLTRKRKDILRSMLKWSFGVYALFIAVLIPILIHTGVPSFGKDSALAILISANFARDWIIAGAAGSAVTMIVLAVVIWNLSKPKRMFS
jgi:hypothetical protein